MRKLLPKVDRALQQRQQASTAAATLEPGAAVPAAGAGKTDAAGAKFCSHCGNKLAAGVRFCAGCGTRTE